MRLLLSPCLPTKPSTHWFSNSKTFLHLFLRRSLWSPLFLALKYVLSNRQSAHLNPQHPHSTCTNLACWMSVSYTSLSTVSTLFIWNFLQKSYKVLSSSSSTCCVFLLRTFLFLGVLTQGPLVWIFSLVFTYQLFCLYPWLVCYSRFITYECTSFICSMNDSKSIVLLLASHKLANPTTPWLSPIHNLERGPSHQFIH